MVVSLAATDPHDAPQFADLPPDLVVVAYLRCTIENTACDLADGLVLGVIKPTRESFGLLAHAETFCNMLLSVEDAMFKLLPA